VRAYCRVTGISWPITATIVPIALDGDPHEIAVAADLT
jgi:hypothetical protein